MPGPLFLTAGHIYANAKCRGGQIAAASLGPGPNQTVVVEDAEVFNGMDRAILKAPGLRADILPFHYESRA